MKKKTMTLPKFGRGAEVRAASFDEAANTVEVTWTTGAAVRRYSYRDGVYYQELLEVSPEAVRLERLNAGAPFLNSHSSYELANVIGSVVPGAARIENGVGVATILLSTAGEDAGIVEKIRAGVIRNVSVGYIIHRVEKTVNGDGADEEWRVVDWEPMEISAVPIPADPGSQIRGAAPDGQPCEFIIRNDAPDDGANEAPDTSAGTTQEDALSDLNAAEAVRETTTGENNNNNVMEARVAETEIETRAAADIEAAARAATDTAIRAERERVAKINELADKHGARALGNEFIGNGKGLEDFRAALLDHLANAEPKTEPVLRATVGTEHVEKRAAVIEAAIMHRVDPAKNELPEGGREFRGMSLVDMARDLLEANGVKVRGMNKFEIASEALSQRSGGLHGTGDFTVILGNTVNRTLRTAYEAAPQTFRPVVRETTVSDFKTVTRAQLGEAPKLEKVNEHGEFKRGTIGEGSESYKVATFGKVIGITRQALINDDLGAFTRLAQMFGVAAADLESDLVWAEILGNPTMGDNVALFHLASHKNLQTAAALSETTLAVMRAAMAKQKGLDGKTTLNIRPTFLFVPVDLENTAEKLLASYATTKPADAVAESIRRLQAISEPRLDNGLTHPVTGAAIAGSSTAHYLAASPAQTDTVELAYLEGARGVYTESKMGFNTDGVEIKVRLDAGAKVIDWRAFQKNAGA